jgi:oligopeptide transport system substrate-binding protein
MLEEKPPLIQPSFLLPKETGPNSDLYLNSYQEIIRSILPDKFISLLKSDINEKRAKTLVAELIQIGPLAHFEMRNHYGLIKTLTPTYTNISHSALVCHLINKRFCTEQRIFIDASQALDFSFKKDPKSQFCVQQFTFQIDDSLKEVLLKRAPIFLNCVKLALQSKMFAIFLNEIGGLLIDEKVFKVSKALIERQEKFPHIFSKNLLFCLQEFLCETPKNYKLIRNAKHLVKLISAMDYYKQDFQKKAFENKTPFIHTKFFPIKLFFPFGTRKGIGCLIAMSKLEENELFLEKHLQNAIEDITSGVQIYKNSYFSFQSIDGLNFIYVELEQTTGKELLAKQLKALKTDLKKEIKAHIERLTHPIFFPRNDEEIIQNILKLTNELKGATDIPQVIIRFDKQEKEALRFLVILIRAKKINSPSLKEAFSKISQYVFKFEQIKIVGKLDKDYEKEANVFYIQIDKKPHLRKDLCIDLMSARSHIVTLLSSSVGDFRDFNGGMIIKQNELFTLLQEGYKQTQVDLFLLEHFFYSLTPITMQTTLSITPLKTLFSLLQDGIARKIEQRNELIAHFDKNYCAFIFSSTFETKELLDRLLDPLITQDSELAKAFITLDQTTYFAYLYLHSNPTKQRNFSQILKQTLEKSTKRVKVDKHIKLNLPDGITSLDPRLSHDQPSGLVKIMLYEGLMRLDKEQKISFGVAEKVDISKDQKVFTFHLRDCYWSNKDRVKAQDFELAWKKVLDPNFHTLYAYVFFMIKNAQKASEGLCSLEEIGIHSIDDKTLRVELEYPGHHFLELTTNWSYFPVNSKSEQTHPGWAFTGAETLVTNGPFSLKEWDINKKMELIKNQNYWDKKNVGLEKISIFFIEDAHMQKKLYSTNELDFLGYPLDTISKSTFNLINFKEDLHYFTSDSILWIELNTKYIPFKSKKIRKAFAFAIDRNYLCNHIPKIPNIPAYEILTPNISLTNTPYFQEDLKQAKKLFAQGLKELKIKKEELRPIKITHPETFLWQQVAIELKKMWETAFDIQIETESFPWAELLKLITQSDFQLAGTVWYSWFSDPIYTLDVFKYKTRSLNCTLWEHPKYIKCLDQAEQSIDLKKRNQYLQKAEQIFMEEMPVIPIWHINEAYLQKPYLKNVILNSTGCIDFKYTTIEENI